MTVKAKPDGYHSVTPYLIVKDGSGAIEYYKKAFGAQELFRLSGTGRKARACRAQDRRFDRDARGRAPQMGALAPGTIGGSPVHLMLYVDNVDEVVPRAVAAGAKILRPVADQFYGDRSGGIEDPFGHHWYVATHKEDVSPEEMKRRAEAMFLKKG